MANENFRQQTALGLTNGTCANCSGTQPAYYEVNLCGGLGNNIIVSGTQGFSGGSLQTMLNTYSVGDFVCVAASSSGTRIRAEIISTTSTGVIQYYIDFGQPTANSCISCFQP